MHTARYFLRGDSVKTTVTFDASSFTRGITATQTKVLNGTAEIIYAQAQEVMKASIAECPKSTGTLASTAFVGKVRRGVVTDVNFGYTGQARNPVNGRLASAYAVREHEDMALQHPNGKAKFLEDPLAECGRTMHTTLGRKIKKLFV